MSLPVFWLIVGTVFCLMELLIPTAFVESTLGFAAFVVALLALVIPDFGWQIFLWMIFSLLFILALRRFAPKRTPYTLADSTEAQTLTTIPPGQSGRVLYEGNSWRARCEDRTCAIASNQRVYVVGREGNTLLVLPEEEVHS